MLASTFGQGAYAINLAPILFPDSTALDPSSVSGEAPDGTPQVTTATPLVDGESEITGFGNATRITIVDETSFSFTGTLTDGSAIVTGLSSTTGLAAGLVITGTGIPTGTTIESVDAATNSITLSANATASFTATGLTARDQTYGQVIGGFNPSKVAGTNIAANWTNSLGDFSIPINSGIFTSNGLKTVEVYATDDAGSVGNMVTLSFTLERRGNCTPVGACHADPVTRHQHAGVHQQSHTGA